jgi:hypothetical protein
MIFFYQLLLPVVDPVMSETNDDPCMGYYEEVVKINNMYAFEVKNRRGTRGHVFCPNNAKELLVWDKIVCRNLNTKIAKSWMINQSNTFDREISEAMYLDDGLT